MDTEGKGISVVNVTSSLPYSSGITEEPPPRTSSSRSQRNGGGQAKTPGFRRWGDSDLSIKQTVIDLHSDVNRPSKRRLDRPQSADRKKQKGNAGMKDTVIASLFRQYLLSSDMFPTLVQQKLLEYERQSYPFRRPKKGLWTVTCTHPVKSGQKFQRI